MRFKESDLPQGYIVRIGHIRPQDLKPEERTLAPKWTTRARVVGPNGEVVVTAYATCNEKDNPSRKTGREVAKGRALKIFFTEWLPNHPGAVSAPAIEQRATLRLVAHR